MAARSPELTVAFDTPEHGWLGITLSTPRATFTESFSHIFPALRDLCMTLADAASGSDPRPTTFFLEPTELELRLTPELSDVSELAIRVFPDRRRSLRRPPVFTYRGSTRAMVLSFWRALRRLQTCLSDEDFVRAWGEPFPKNEMTSLSRLVAAWKQTLPPGG